jgi:hypothetical protein
VPRLHGEAARSAWPPAAEAIMSALVSNRAQCHIDLRHISTARSLKKVANVQPPMRLPPPKLDPALSDVPPSQGLYRTIIAGPGRSLADAFAKLEQSPQVSRILRHEPRDLLSARVTLHPEEGSGYWELTRIRNDLYIILSDFSYTNPRFEFAPGDGLVQFNFKLSGDLSYGVSRPDPLRFNRPSLHVWRQPQGIDMREWTAPSAHERLVAISVRPQFLIEHLLPDTGDVPPRRNIPSANCVL